MNIDRHHRLVRNLHWVTLLALIFGYSLIWWRDGLDDTGERSRVLAWHATVGLTVLAFAIARLLSRAFGDRLVVPHPLSRLERLGSTASHVLLYVAMIGIPLLGWLTVSARGRMPDVFGLLTLPALIAKDRDLADSLQQWHYLAAMAMLAVVGIHVCGALYHHFIKRDNVLRAMLPLSIDRMLGKLPRGRPEPVQIRPQLPVE